MEDVDMNYQAPFDANSGNGITKFAPTPATKVLKSYNVDGDFLRKAIAHGGVPSQAVDQIMGGIDSQQVDGPLSGSHFDTVMSGFGVQPPIENGSVTPPVGGGAGMEPGAVLPPVGAEAPVDVAVDIDPVASDISAGQPSVPGVPTEPIPAPEETPIDAGSGVGIGGVGTGTSVGGVTPPIEGEEEIEDETSDEVPTV